jgi:hypothetical protein
MSDKIWSRKEFFSCLGKTGAGMCLCGAIAGNLMTSSGETETGKKAEKEIIRKAPDETQPGEKSIERSAKRMEFCDGWIKRFMEVLSQNLDEKTLEKLMKANGKACLKAFSPAGKRRASPVTFEHFAEWIAKEGKAQGYSVVGQDVFSEYNSSAETGKSSPEGICLCPMVEAQVGGKIPSFYCQCSIGYVQEAHERMLGRQVEVRLIDSVLRGGKRCKFKINLL